MSRAKDAVGGYGERIAARVLVEAGMTLLDRNWRCADGELDIVARDRDGTIVFCEVKTRRSNRFGIPAEAVGYAKVRRLRRLAASWLARHRGDSAAGQQVRFDVVSVWPSPSGRATTEHLRGAF
jgi:putative endonuclease